MTTPSVSATTPTVRYDWTLSVAEAVHALLDLAMKRPRLNPGPWVISFTADSRPHITYRASSAPRSAVLISTPGWYRFIWGPTLCKLASYIWRTLADDLAGIGVDVTVPTPEKMRAMYWGPMPGEDGHWGMPGMAVTALTKREAYIQELRADAVITPLPYDFPRADRQPRPLAKTAASANTPAELPAWEFGHWGKGFISASGRLYTWRTNSPKDGGHPQHSQAQNQILAVEDDAVYQAGLQLSGADIAYACPVVIAPDGQYTLESADVFWSNNKYTPELNIRAQSLRERYDAGVFAQTIPALRWIENSEAWSERALGGGASYGHAATVAATLSKRSKT
jgi:hypothetical protein